MNKFFVESRKLEKEIRGGLRGLKYE